MTDRSLEWPALHEMVGNVGKETLSHCAFYKYSCQSAPQLRLIKLFLGGPFTQTENRWPAYLAVPGSSPARGEQKEIISQTD